MPVKVYDGTNWVTVAGDGAQGAAGADATSSSISTWVKTASGGETSVSGTGDTGYGTLAYTVGQELVFLNGVLLDRGDDYTATNGTSITGLTALLANDVVTVWTVNSFSVANTYTQAQADARYPAKAGSILQVVSASTSTPVTVASTTYTDSGLSASITPTSSTSKILVIIDQALYVERAIYVAGGSIQLLRGASVIQATGAVFGFNSGSSPGSNLSALQGMNGINYLDSPATTSSVTYKTQIKADTTANSGYIAAQFNSTFSSITLLEIGA